MMSSNLLPSGLTPHELRGHLDCLRATKPPYTCPLANCDRVYKSYSGIQSHLMKFQHVSPTVTTDGRTDASATGVRDDGPVGVSGKQRSGQQVTWTQAQKIIDVDVGGKIVRLNTFEPIPVSFVDGQVPKPEEKKLEPIPVPRAVFREAKEFEPSKMKSFPTSYIRYMEKTAEELDEEIEYDMDEEDNAWLEIINERRLHVGLPRVSEATFEFVMNRLEKDSYFKTSPGTGFGLDATAVGRLHFEEDDDTVCCVCGDGECDNANAILFCDMCNLAVHQECYGVPYIPEGQWLCRRCQLSPSRGVDCRLCPNKGGAFKQTSDNGWSHVICALWVPEVQFANTVFLEPIEGFDRIPTARWKLSCYICKQKSRGACIQCHKPSCYTAFHVTCAQQAGLYMKMETVHDPKSPDGGISVRKSAFCDVHSPNNGGDQASADERGKKNESENRSRQSEPPKLSPKFDMRRARKLLSQKRNLSPIVSVPVVPRRKLEQLSHQLRFAGKQEFMDRILRFWTLKRRSRFGVPLLRRLQVTHHASRLEKERMRNKELQDQYNSWRQLRQDLEKARLLMELVRKRERKKREQMQVTEETWDRLLWGAQQILIEAIAQLEEIDEKKVFTQPVDDSDVPGYSRIIKSPMDLSTMREKVERLEYKDFGHMEKDFDLMMVNCMKFNVQNEYYKSYGNKYKKRGLEILRQSRQIYMQMIECRTPLLDELQRDEMKAASTAFTIKDVLEEPSTAATDATPTLKKGNTKQQKSATTTAKKRKTVGEEASMNDMPTLEVVDTPSKKGKQATTKSKQSKTTPASKTTKDPLPASKTIKEEESKGAKKKGTKLTTAGKKQKEKNTTSTPVSSKVAKKGQQKGRASVTERGKRKVEESDEEDEKPLTALVTKTPEPGNVASDNDKFAVPMDNTDIARPSFRVFREDRRSPNSSAVESEIEPASGDEGGYFRKKGVMATVPMDDATVDQLSPEHLDFVWAHVEGKPWMPGVVIDPTMEYEAQSAVRYIAPAAVLSKKMDNAYLVMLFDEETSWHWLKREALQMLGLEPETDKRRLQQAGSAQSTVIRAYERALEARNLVTGDDLEGDEEHSGPPVIDQYRRSSESGASSA